MSDDNKEIADQKNCNEAISRLITSGALYQNERVPISFNCCGVSIVTGRWNHQSDPLRGVPGAGLPSLIVSLKPEIILCSGCKRSTSFGPHDSNRLSGVDVFSMKCSVCERPIFFAIRNGFLEGDNQVVFQLVGRNPMYLPSVKAPFPSAIRRVVSDALLAVAQSDLPAGFYHLRTAIEIYMKEVTEEDIDAKIDGNELVDKYKSKMGNLIPPNAPSFKTIYSDLSRYLHSRKGSAEDFERLRGQVELHFEAIEVNKKLASFAASSDEP